MTPEHYQQVGRLYHTALELDREDRVAFLERACAGDEEMRREVESLIASHEQASDFIRSRRWRSPPSCWPRARPTH